MPNILRRLWPRRRAAARITMGVHVVKVPKPIPLTVPREEGAACWYGYWDAKGCWCWGGQDHPYAEDTHWLPATAEVLPSRCCAPEVE